MPASLSPSPHPAAVPASACASIGIFDSGLGGLSVLRALRSQLPHTPMSYIADSGHAPYGEREAAHVIERSRWLVGQLLERGARLIVVACNTATALAISSLRQQWPELPFIGVEPGIKPALSVSRSGHIGVLATEGTLGSDRFRQLLARHSESARVHLQPCPGLAALIEEAELDSPALRQLVASCCAPLNDQQIDTVVLGCTHYPFVQGLIQAALGPAVTVIDTADAVARQTARQWQLLNAGTAPDPQAAAGAMAYYTTGDAQRLQRVLRDWLGEQQPAQQLPA